MARLASSRRATRSSSTPTSSTSAPARARTTPVTAAVSYGETFTVQSGPTAANGYEWYSVSGLVGAYIAGDFLSLQSGGTPGGGSFTYGQSVVVNTDLLNVRSLPSLSGSVLTVYAAGRTAKITGGPTTADGITWYAVDNTGWVAGQYLALSDGYNPGNPGGTTDDSVVDTGAYTYGLTVTTTTNLFVRTGPSLSDTVIDIYKTGRTAKITGGPTDADGITWYAVDNYGWVSGEYLAG